MLVTHGRPRQRGPGGPVVLVAEDEALVAAVLGEALEIEGFRVILAPDGLSALSSARRRPIDLLLTDLDMPRLDGAGLIARLRSERPGLPVVVMSGRLPPDGGRALGQGATGPFAVLAKPFPFAVLVATLRRMLATPGGGGPLAGPVAPPAPAATPHAAPRC